MLFDLDGTLYSADNGYIHHIRQNLFALLVRKGFAADLVAAEQLWQPLFRQYNQSLRGLRAGGYAIDADEYWPAHRGGMETFFTQPDAGLRELLMRLPSCDKHIFTNCREQEAEHALQLLGVRDCFNRIYGADFMGNCCKPEPASFEAVLNDLQLPHAQQQQQQQGEVILFEDSLKNLRAAKELFGMRTVLVHSMTAEEEGAADFSKSSQLEYVDAAVTTLSDGGAQLQAVMPDLFASD